jgi:hypothetical protein
MLDFNWVTMTYLLCGVLAIVFVIFTVVVTIGGVIDLVIMFRELESETVDISDDGRVDAQKTTSSTMTE